MQDSIAKEKKWGKKMSENFHFDYLNPSLMENMSEK